MKALCFLALPHHNKILLPVMDELKRRGIDVIFCTAQAEAGFEITLQEANLKYIHALDYAQSCASDVVIACDTFRGSWLEKVLSIPGLAAIPLPIQDKVIQAAIENVFCFDAMIKDIKPDIIFALHELNPWGKTLGYLSHCRRIPYMTF